MQMHEPIGYESRDFGGLNAEGHPETGVAFLTLSPAVSYSPTGSPLQYHRR